MIPVPTQALGIDSIQMIDQEIHLIIDTRIIPTVGVEATQIIEINDIKTLDHEIIQTTDQLIKDLTSTTIKIDHKITHRIETQNLTIDKETIPSRLIGIILIIPILKTNIEIIHHNIKVK